MAHNKGNNYEMPPDWEEIFHDELCKQNPHYGIQTCQRISNGGRIARSAVMFAAAFSYGKVLLEFIKAGGQYVSQEEANERASICRGCPMNGRENWGCGSCSQRIQELVEKLLGKRETPLDADLGYCGICSCSLKASVHYPLEAQAKGVTDEMMESFESVSNYCWKAKIKQYR